VAIAQLPHEPAVPLHVPVQLLMLLFADAFVYKLVHQYAFDRLHQSGAHRLEIAAVTTVLAAVLLLATFIYNRYRDFLPQTALWLQRYLAMAVMSLLSLIFSESAHAPHNELQHQNDSGTGTVQTSPLIHQYAVIALIFVLSVMYSFLADRIHAV
jgi:hypothetical protein